MKWCFSRIGKNICKEGTYRKVTNSKKVCPISVCGVQPIQADMGFILLALALTHYQTTNFRIFQTERVCRQQFQI